MPAITGIILPQFGHCLGPVDTSAGLKHMEGVLSFRWGLALWGFITSSFIGVV